MRDDDDDDAGDNDINKVAVREQMPALLECEMMMMMMMMPMITTSTNSSIQLSIQYNT